jgi:hypothetical protein
MAFFCALQAAIADHYFVAVKVRVADVIDCSAAAWVKGFGFMVARHHVDMALSDRQTMSIVAVIELDDRSHDRPERRRRDQFLNAAFSAAQMPLLRFIAAANYQPSVIRERILKGLATTSAELNRAEGPKPKTTCRPQRLSKVRKQPVVQLRLNERR